MPNKEILQLGNPLLWQKSERVEDYRAIMPVVRDLSDTLAAFRESHGFGRAIAAPQIGVGRRVIFVRMPAGFSGPLINPEIVWADSRKMELWDDCFSFPNLLVRVERAYGIKVQYFDEQGARQTIDAEGDFSELLQHEIDHLDGILAVDRAISPRAFCMRSEWETLYNHKDTENS